MSARKKQKTARGKRSQDRLVLWAFLIILLFFGGLILRKYLVTEPPPRQVVDTTPRELRDVTLYFATLDGMRLVAEGREIDDCLDETDCVVGTVQALIDGPVGELAPIFPSHVILNGVGIEDGMIAVDFSKDLVVGHPGGTQSELLTVYALVDTLVTNFPHLRQVRILIDGQPVDTLKGHVDLRQPFSPDFSLVEEGAAPVGDLPAMPSRSEE